MTNQFWWGKVHFVELMDVLYLCCYGYFACGLDAWESASLTHAKAYTFQPYSGLVYRISIHDGYIRPRLFNSSPQSTGTLGRQESMRLENGCEHMFLFQNSGCLLGDSPTTTCQRSHPYLNRYFKYHWLCWVTLHFRLCNKAPKVLTSATQKN